MASLNEWLKFRKQYLKGKKNFEGYYVCAKCGKWCLAIEVDHIQERSTHPDLIFVLSNLQLLCFDCHRKKHNQ